MNILNVVVNNKFLASSVCFAGGYALNSAYLAVNQLAVKYLGLPIDVFDHKTYDEWKKNLIEINKKYALENNQTLDRALGVGLFYVTFFAVREEISYRYLLETIVLPCICPQFAVFSIARACVSSLLFAARHLHNPSTPEGLAAQFLNAAITGLVCSLAKERIGLIGAIFVHIGCNVHAWHYAYNENPKELLTQISAVHLSDAFNLANIRVFVTEVIGDALSPFILTYRATRKIAHSLGISN
jgi:membrane protease YdiL (CAAX protease family)